MGKSGGCIRLLKTANVFFRPKPKSGLSIRKQWQMCSGNPMPDIDKLIRDYCDEKMDGQMSGIRRIEKMILSVPACSYSGRLHTQGSRGSSEGLD